MSSPSLPRTRQRVRSRTAPIRRAIATLDHVAPGTLSVVTKKCGKPTCRCATDPAGRHGPYFEWTRRAGGRLMHHLLTEEQAEEVARAIANRREIDRLLSQWEVVTVEEILRPVESEADD